MCNPVIPSSSKYLAEPTLPRRSTNPGFMQDAAQHPHSADNLEEVTETPPNKLYRPPTPPLRSNKTRARKELDKIEIELKVGNLPEISKEPLYGTVSQEITSCFTRATCTATISVYGKSFELENCLSSKPFFKSKKFLPLTIVDPETQETQKVYVKTKKALQILAVSNRVSIPVELSPLWIRGNAIAAYAKALHDQLSIHSSLVSKIAIYILENMHNFEKLQYPNAFSPNCLPQIKLCKIDQNLTTVYFKKRAFYDESTYSEGTELPRGQHPHQIGEGASNVVRLTYDIKTLAPWIRRIQKVSPENNPYRYQKRIFAALSKERSLATPCCIQSDLGKMQNRPYVYHKLIHYMKYYNAGDTFFLMENMLQLKGSDEFGFQDLIDVLYHMIHDGRCLEKARIVHGDIKLENFLLESSPPDSPSTYPRWSASMADMDHACFLSDEEAKNYFRGTPEAIPPEIAKYITSLPGGIDSFISDRPIIESLSFPISTKSDIWALGLVFLDLLSAYSQDEEWKDLLSYPSIYLNNDALNSKALETLPEELLSRYSGEELMNSIEFKNTLAMVKSKTYLEIRAEMDTNPLSGLPENVPAIFKMTRSMLEIDPNHRPSFKDLEKEFLKHYQPRPKQASIH